MSRCVRRSEVQRGAVANQGWFQFLESHLSPRQQLLPSQRVPVSWSLTPVLWMAFGCLHQTWKSRKRLRCARKPVAVVSPPVLCPWGSCRPSWVRAAPAPKLAGQSKAG